ncbi:hypothetical protein WME94_27715 [Sorangium sp. So ce429]
MDTERWDPFVLRVATLVPGDRIPESYAALGPDALGLFDERNRPLLAPAPLPGAGPLTDPLIL